MSYTAPTILLSIASEQEIQQGIDMLQRLLGGNIPVPMEDPVDPKPEVEELSPQQKAAITRAKNKAAKEAAAQAAAEAPAQPASPAPEIPAVPTTASAPAAAVPTAPVPAAGSGVVTTPGTVVPMDYNTMSAEASAKHQQLSMTGRGQDLINLLGQYGVQRLDALPAEHWEAFITGVRAL